MAERRVSFVSLVTGLLALSVAGFYLLHRSHTIAVDGYVVFAGTVVALGVGGVATAAYGIFRGRSTRQPDGDAG